MGKRTGPVKDPGTPAGRSRRTAKSPAEDPAPEMTAAPTSPEAGDTPLGDEPGEIRENIEQTRAQMGGTLGALQEKLSPSHLKDQVKESVQEHIEEAKSALRAATVGKVETMIRDTGNTLSEARQSLWETIRENPVPAALSAIGLTWLFLNRGGRDGGRRYQPNARYTGGVESDEFGRGYGAADRGLESRAGGAVREVKDRASDLVDSAQQKASDLAATASDTAGRVADQAQIQARRVEQAIGRWMDENPIALGAVALAAGTAIGLALPRTEKEDQLLGSARDTVVDKAQQLASEAVDTVRDRFSDAQEQPQTH